MKNYIPALAFVSLLSFVSCSNTEVGGNTASSNESVQDTSLSLFHAIPVDSIVSPIDGVRVMSYSAEHIDSSFKLNYLKLSEKGRDSLGTLTPTEANSISIQFLQFEDKAHGGIWKKINDTLRYLVMGNNSAAKALLYNDSTLLETIYTESVSMDLLTWTKDYVSISQNIGGYYGGAHGMYGSTYYTFMIKSGERLNYNLVFGLDNLETLKGIVKKYYNQEYGDTYTAVGESFSLPSCFAFSREGIKFLYNPYEMGTYADGLREVTVPYKAMKEIINPAYISLK